ncbi:interleukin-27 receptor subunit alpha isoform X1 [Sturnira hondurensis]|uniref:interleukin-27 receptor subunit alpha isoform X1 n=1 Tax=Sturnira hondurensis TaxID=192404 RepID=UPI0018796E29|nr:interleukin-27 receptor subunit alpha isoform X1 [Sturnira hondurensis]
MKGARATPCQLLPLLLLLFHRTSSHSSLRPLRCYGVGPLGDLNCSWESLGDLGAPSMLYLQSQKYHSNRTWTVAVPTGWSWVTIPRERFTASDELLVWGAKAGQPLWPPVFVNLETQMKPEAPHLDPDVDFTEDDPLEATVHWSPPAWPPHKVLVCQFHYRKCQQMAWTLLEPELKSIPLTPVEIQGLELATGYEVSGRCRMEKEEDLWGEWSPILSFQTLHSAPKDVWISGNLCETQGGQKSLLLWKAPGQCVQASYRVWFQVKGQELISWETPCCSSSIPIQAERVAVSAVNATSWEPLTNLSLVCLDSGSAPRGVVVSSIAGSTELLVTWQQGSGEPQEHVVDWAQDGEPLENLSWVRLPPGNLSAVLQGNFERGVPYRITVTAVSPRGLYPAPSVWSFREELAPLVGPALWRLQDAPPGTPTIAWGEVPRHQLRGLLTHYTLCAQSGTRPSVCMNVSGSTQKITLPSLPWGPCELWMTASTIAGQGPPGPSLRLHLPDNTLKLKILPVFILLWGLFLTCCGLSLATSGRHQYLATWILFPESYLPSRCLHLQHKVLPRWVWEKVPDPANSNSSKPHVEEIPQAQPPRDSPTLEVEEVEPVPVVEHPQASSRLDSGYEKHFLPTPEELGLLGPPPPGPRVWPELGQERSTYLTTEDTEA